MTTQQFSIKRNLGEILAKLVQKYGIPEIRKDLAIYYKNDTSKQVHLRFRNNNCSVMIKDSDTNDPFRPKIHIDTSHTDMRAILTFFKKIGYKKASVGLATCYSFYHTRDSFLELLTNTFIGDFIQIGYEEDKNVQKDIEWLKTLDISPMKSNDLKSLVGEADIKYSEVINDLNVIDNDIYNFSKSAGLDIESSSTTLREYLLNFNNDYTYLERAFESIFKTSFLGQYPVDAPFRKFFTPASIIISCYNSGETYLKTLLSINSQKLDPEQFSKLDVILVDDGSTIPVAVTIKKTELNLKFPCRVIRLEKNSGLASARNAGLSQALHNIIILLDSDVVLSKNYIIEHVLRNTLIPNAVFISFKQNLDPSNKILSTESILNGLEIPDIGNDLRVHKVVSENAKGLYEMSGKMDVGIIGATNYFKDLSYGRHVGIYDLPSMVIGHNISFRKNNSIKVGGFYANFKGWGMEDTYFGAKMVAEGNFVIPVLACGVYHIDHPPRSGSEQNRISEFEKNLAIYRELLDRPYEQILS
jgi:glycosyltransferase involved in cell wall biosynthesis